jgi:SAM-dependent methyltransferase
MKLSRLLRQTAAAALKQLTAGTTPPWKLNLPLLARAIERGDHSWPSRTAQWVRGGDVLDVGCGRNLQAIGFRAAGARSYTGLDPTLNLDSTLLKDSRKRWGKRTEAGISPRQLMASSSRVRFAVATIAEFAAEQPGQFDVIVMHNVTEHLMAIEEEFPRFVALLRPGGCMVFRHPNFYCWHGHHLRPRTVEEIVPGDPEQSAVVDWAHVRRDPARHEWIDRTQNRISLDALRALVERYFTIEKWEEKESGPEQGIERLTPEILARYPEFTRRELAVKCAFIVARKARTAALAIIWGGTSILGGVLTATV